jgi:pimeloyl-ACP methyl ester carboxylesterase
MPSHQYSNYIFFIGGGADKTRERFGIVYWGPTKLMGYARLYFEHRQGPYSKTEYYGYLDKKEIVKKIVKLRRKYPDLRINIVGHSRGGAVAKDIAVKLLRKKGINVNLLIALDPVKAKLRSQYKIPKKKGLKNVGRFISVFAKPKRRNGADYIALIGGQYGTRLQKRSHNFIQASVGHGQPIPLLKVAVNPGGETVLDLLVKESNTP